MNDEYISQDILTVRLRRLGADKMAVARLEIIDKWGQAVAERGFAQVPNYLLLINQFLDAQDRLPPIELTALIQLVGSWWKKDESPFPSLKTLALRSGVSERQMQRAINSLELKGLIKREKRKTRGIITTNTYDMNPLVEVLSEIATVYDNPFKRIISKDRREKQRKAGKKIALGNRNNTKNGSVSQDFRRMYQLNIENMDAKSAEELKSIIELLKEDLKDITTDNNEDADTEDGPRRRRSSKSAP